MVTKPVSGARIVKTPCKSDDAARLKVLPLMFAPGNDPVSLTMVPLMVWLNAGKVIKANAIAAVTLL